MVNNSLKNNILFFFGMFIIGYILFIRLILKKLPKDLDKDFSIIMKLIFVEIFLIFLICLLNSIRNYLIDNKIYKPKSYDKGFIIYIKTKIKILTEFGSESLLLVHKKLIETQFSFIIEKIGSKIPKLLKFHNTYLLTIVFNYLPKLIVLSSFFIDVFLFHQINYFYRTASLLLIPLIYQYGCFAIYNDAINGIIESDNYLIITPINSSEQIKGFDYFKEYCRHRISYYNEFDFSQFKYNINDNFLKSCPNIDTINQRATLEHFMLQINLLVDIASYTQFISVWYETHAPAFNIFLYGMYVFGWAYVFKLIV